MNVLPLLSPWSQIQTLWQSPIVCGLSDRGANKRVLELATGGTSEPMPAEALGARCDATTSPPKAAWAPNTSRTSAEMAGCSQLWCTTYSSKFDFLKDMVPNMFGSYWATLALWVCGTPEIQAVLEWEEAERHMTGMTRDVQCYLYEMRLNQSASA